MSHYYLTTDEDQRIGATVAVATRPLFGADASATYPEFWQVGVADETDLPSELVAQNTALDATRWVVVSGAEYYSRRRAELLAEYPDMGDEIAEMKPMELVCGSDDTVVHATAFNEGEE